MTTLVKHGHAVLYNITSIYVCTTREDNSFTNFLHLCQQQVKFCKPQRHANRIYGTPIRTLSVNPFVRGQSISAWRVNKWSVPMKPIRPCVPSPGTIMLPGSWSTGYSRVRSEQNNCWAIAPTATHPSEQAVEEVGVNQWGVETPQWSVEHESGECSVIVVTNADIDPWAVVVHLHYTPDARERREKGGGRRIRVFFSQCLQHSYSMFIHIHKLNQYS